MGADQTWFAGQADMKRKTEPHCRLPLWALLAQQATQPKGYLCASQLANSYRSKLYRSDPKFNEVLSRLLYVHQVGTSQFCRNKVKNPGEGIVKLGTCMSPKFWVQATNPEFYPWSEKQEICITALVKDEGYDFQALFTVFHVPLSMWARFRKM